MSKCKDCDFFSCEELAEEFLMGEMSDEKFIIYYKHVCHCDCKACRIVKSSFSLQATYLGIRFRTAIFQIRDDMLRVIDEYQKKMRGK